MPNVFIVKQFILTGQKRKTRPLERKRKSGIAAQNTSTTFAGV